jgi:alpha,alpha-trehalose phosphorylase
MSTAQTSTDPLDRSRFPADPWRLVECDPDRTDLGVTETLFTVANGYIGMRGNPEEGRHAHEHGTYINGFHETWPIRHAEAAYGFARTGQTLVNAPDAKLMKLYVDDEPLVIGTADLESYERSLDFRDGVLRRYLVWRTPSGKRVEVVSTRMVSMTQRHLVLLTSR